MTIHSIETLDDALRVALFYELDCWYMSAGTTQGFVNWLFVRHTLVTTEQLSALTGKYEQEHIEYGARGLDLDARMQGEADECMSGHHLHAQAVSTFVWGIKKLKCSRLGVLAWDATAALATTTPEERLKLMADLAPEVRRELPQAFEVLKTSDKLLSSPTLPYSVYSWSLNQLICSGIRRLDVSLVEDSMWHDNDWHYPIEFAALSQLLKSHVGMLETATLN